LDANTWGFDLGNLHVNNEQEYYTSNPENVSVKDGYLQITALPAPNYNGSGQNYTSARIITANKYSFKYGYVEIRAKVPGDQGTWPALWLLGNNINTGVNWPQCGEIDMMEMGTVTGLNNILSSLHWGGDKSGQRNVPGANTDFHLYQMDWRADHIAFYIDSTLLYSQPNNGTLPFNQGFFFIFNVAVGGDMGGNNINLGSGSTMYVDYVRVYN
jgi:beta-glucanase (GH16 family)